MGHVSKRGDRWLARWRGPDGREHSRSFRRKLDADRFLTTVSADILRGTYIDPRAGRVTVAEYAAAWTEGQPWRPQSRSKIEGDIRVHVVPVLGGRPLGSLRTSEVQAWVSGLSAKGLAPTTVMGAYRALAAMLRAAVTDRIIPSSPAKGVRLPRREDAERIVPLSVQQVEALAGGMPPRFAAIVPVAAGLGLRRGEALGLTVDRVDFLRRQVTIDRQLIGGEFAPPKTRRSTRTIPLPDAVAGVLAEHLRTIGAGGRGLVFTREDGRPLSPGILQAAFDRARRLAKIDDTFHGLRHFTASALINAGCSVVAVQSYLGHATAAETLGTYSHLWPSDDDRIRAAVDLLFKGDAGSTRDLGTGQSV